LSKEMIQNENWNKENNQSLGVIGEERRAVQLQALKTLGAMLRHTFGRTKLSGVKEDTK
jgi:hypothetical protein